MYHTHNPTQVKKYLTPFLKVVGEMKVSVGILLPCLPPPHTNNVHTQTQTCCLVRPLHCMCVSPSTKWKYKGACVKCPVWL